MNNNLVMFTATVCGSKLRVKETIIEVVEKSKCFDTIVKPSRRFRKSILGEVRTNLINTIGGGAGSIGYSTICLPKDLVKGKSDVLLAVSEKVKDIYETSSKLMEAIKHIKNNKESLDFLNEIHRYGWVDVPKGNKRFGSVFDLYFYRMDEYEITHYLMIDDGSVNIDNSVLHIYTSDCLEDKIFEGRVETPAEFITIMKVLGYKKLKN